MDWILICVQRLHATCPFYLTPYTLNYPYLIGSCFKLTVRSSVHFLAGHLYWKTLRQGTYQNLGLGQSTRHIIWTLMPILALPLEILFLVTENVQSRSPLSTGLLMLISLSWTSQTSGLSTTAVGDSEYARPGCFFILWKSGSTVSIQRFSILGLSHQGQIVFCQC